MVSITLENEEELTKFLSEESVQDWSHYHQDRRTLSGDDKRKKAIGESHMVGESPVALPLSLGMREDMQNLLPKRSRQLKNRRRLRRRLLGRRADKGGRGGTDGHRQQGAPGPSSQVDCFSSSFSFFEGPCCQLWQGQGSAQRLTSPVRPSVAQTRQQPEPSFPIP